MDDMRLCAAQPALATDRFARHPALDFKVSWRSRRLKRAVGWPKLHARLLIWSEATDPDRF